MAYPRTNPSNVHTLSAKIGRRKAIARMTEPYPHLLVTATGKTVVCEKRESGGRHYDLPKNQQRKAAVIISAQIMASFFMHRARLEHGYTPLDAFHALAKTRVLEYQAATFEADVDLSSGAVAQRALLEFERPWVQAIFGAFTMEMMQETVDETRFWRDIFLGISDADPSGVLGEAARLVFLDHSLEFDLALSKTLLAQANAEGIPTLQ